MANDKQGYVYLVWLREFFHKNEPVYKVGRTANIINRMLQYPKGSKVIFAVGTGDMFASELKVRTELSEHFINRTDIGREYYEGDVNRMLCTIWDTLKEIDGLQKATDPDVTSNEEQIQSLGIREEAPARPKKLAKDPMVCIGEFMDLHRESLNKGIKKSLDVYNLYMQGEEVAPVSHKAFVKALKNMYGVKSDTNRFDDGIHQGLFFPDLISGREQQELLKQDVGKHIPQWFRENFEKAPRSNAVPLQAVFAMFEAEYGADVISKRKFGDMMSSIGITTTASHGQRLYRGWKLKTVE